MRNLKTDVHCIIFIINYLLTESEVLTVKYQTEGRGLIFYRKNLTVEVNK